MIEVVQVTVPVVGLPFVPSSVKSNAAPISGATATANAGAETRENVTNPKANSE
jgi:hypothetical protein